LHLLKTFLVKLDSKQCLPGHSDQSTLIAAKKNYRDTYNRDSRFISNTFALVTLEQNVLRLQVSMRQSDRVQEFDGFQRLSRYFANVLKVKTFVLVVLDKVVKALAERFED
jgi:hypothetical protein